MNPMRNGGMGDMMRMVQMMQNGKSGVKSAMKEMGIAGILADIINAQRLDAKRMGQSVDADVSIGQMTEDRAAELIADAIKGDLTEFAKTFDDLQDKRDTVLGELLDEDEYDEYLNVRNSSLPRIGDNPGEEDE